MKNCLLKPKLWEKLPVASAKAKTSAKVPKPKLCHIPDHCKTEAAKLYTLLTLSV